MADDLYPVAGCHIYIGGVKARQSAPFVAADFDGETWVEIGGWVEMGDIGDSAETIDTILINENRVIHQKGSADAGTMQNVFAIQPGNAGQAALRAAAVGTNKSNYAFRIVYNDAPEGGTPSETMFIALAMNTTRAGGGANTIRNLNITLGINSNLVDVDAAEATP